MLSDPPGDAGFQAALDSVSGKVIGATEFIGAQKRACFPQPQVCQRLEVFAVHPMIVGAASRKFVPAMGIVCTKVPAALSYARLR